MKKYENLFIEEINTSDVIVTSTGVTGGRIPWQQETNSTIFQLVMFTDQGTPNEDSYET